MGDTNTREFNRRVSQLVSALASTRKKNIEPLPLTVQQYLTYELSLAMPIGESVYVAKLCKTLPFKPLRSAESRYQNRYVDLLLSSTGYAIALDLFLYSSTQYNGGLFSEIILRVGSKTFARTFPAAVEQTINQEKVVTVHE